MRDFFHAAIGFPTFLFTAALLVVIAFWLLVLLGVAGSDGFDHGTSLDALGFGGVPVTVSVSLFAATGWFASLCGQVLLARFGVGAGGGLPGIALGVALLLVSLLIAHRLTRTLVRPLVVLYPDEPVPSRLDFVGRTCVIRTGRVDTDFGQAEVAARDGSTALVQVRQPGDNSGEAPLRLGSTGLLYAYEEDGEFFWVAPYGATLDQLDALS
jgi:hypothetical protein